MGKQFHCGKPAATARCPEALPVTARAQANPPPPEPPARSWIIPVPPNPSAAYAGGNSGNRGNPQSAANHCPPVGGRPPTHVGGYVAALGTRSRVRENVVRGEACKFQAAGRMQSSVRRVSGAGKPAGPPGAVTRSPASIFAATCGFRARRCRCEPMVGPDSLPLSIAPRKILCHSLRIAGRRPSGMVER